MESSCGKVYVRQRNPNGGGGTGVLRELNVTSDADGERYLVAKNEVDRKKKRRWFNSDCDQVRPYNPKGELLGLAECCVAFVSAHLDLLESLQDFPEEIGGRIWRRALGDGNCERNLGVFAEAYPRAFLPDCRISSLVLLDDRVDLWPALLVHVRSLDLSDCQMGDRHELVGELYRFASLSRLSLKGNLLTAAGVRRMVLPSLADGAAFASLAYLDLRENGGVDGKSVVRVASSIPALQRIAVTLSPLEEERVCDGLQSTFRRMTRPHLEPLEGTTGWASGLLDAWSQRLEEKLSRRKRTSTAATRGTGFYGVNKRIKFDIETLTSTRLPKCEDGSRVVMFHRIKSLVQVLQENGMMAVEAKPSGQTRIISEGASDTDAYILSMYKK